MRSDTLPYDRVERALPTATQNTQARRALFLEGFRNYDMQRFNVPFNPAVGAPFPSKGGTYGNTRCLPLPDVERFNNPSIT